MQDDALVASLYSQKLTEAGFGVAVAEDGIAAVKLLSQWKPDLVVLDLLMPRMTGADVLKFIRERPELKNVHLVVLSNSFLSNLVEQAAAARVESALVKSDVTPAKLVNVVRNLLDVPPASADEVSDEVTPSKREEVGADVSTLPATPIDDQSEPAAEKGPDAEFFERVHQQFFEQKPAILKSLRDMCRSFLEAADASTEQRRLNDLTRKMGFVCLMNTLAGCQDLARLSSALEALLFELCQKPALINESSRQNLVYFALAAFIFGVRSPAWRNWQTR